MQRSVEVSSVARLNFDYNPDMNFNRAILKPKSVVKLRGARIESKKELSLARESKQK